MAFAAPAGLWAVAVGALLVVGTFWVTNERMDAAERAADQARA